MIPGFGHDTWWLILAKALLVFVFLVLTVLVAILAERKILGRMQMRWGPNRVGPRGYLQSLADGIKLALKEPITPFGVEKPIFLLAPAISTIPAITAFAFIPFGPVMGLSAVLGPILAGFLLHADLLGTGWRAIFWVNVPVGVVASYLAVRYLPRHLRTDPRARLDPLGTTLLTAASVTLIYPLVQGHDQGWPSWM